MTTTYEKLAGHVVTALIESGFIHSGDDEKHITELDDGAYLARYKDARRVVAGTLEMEFSALLSREQSPKPPANPPGRDF